MTRPWRLPAAALTTLTLAGCGAATVTGGPARPSASDPGPATSPTTTSQHVCAGTKSPGPPPAMAFVAHGHPGNEWTILLKTDDVTVRFTITQRPRTEIVTMQFAIVPKDASWGSPTGGGFTGAVRTFAPVAKDWAPGEHIAAATWDGLDDKGRQVSPGLYRLVAEAITNSDRDVRCRDGSGRGVEKSPGAREGSGLGLIKVTRQHAGAPSSDA